ncbi:MAG: DUF1801 domain-containing protein [Chloroflexota bacterium]|jgi:hypothetical protein
MTELKTKQNDASVDDFLGGFPEETRRDCYEILKMMKQATKAEPKMWGTSIVGFGSYHYKSERSKQEGDWFLVGLSPRKQNLSIYIMTGFERYGDLLQKLGKHSLGKGCLYIKRLSDVDKKVLKELITDSVRVMKASHKKGQ